MRTLLVSISLALALLVGGGSLSAQEEPGEGDKAEPAGEGEHAAAGEGDKAEPAGEGEHAAVGEGDKAGEADHGAAGEGDKPGEGDHAAGEGDKAGEGEHGDDHPAAAAGVGEAGVGEAGEGEAGEGAAAGGEGAEAGDDEAAEDDDEPPYVEYDTDGDGKVEPEEAAFQKEYDEAFADMPEEVTDAALDQRPEDAELTPSLSVEEFRKLVRFAKAKVMTRLEAAIKRKMAKKMARFTLLIVFFSLTGLLLLGLPFFLNKRYPGRMGMLFKYSALAAGTFIVTVNLFGAVMLMMRGVQGATANYTNPQLAIAAGFFDSLDEHAPDYITTGKELFAPTLQQLTGKGGDESPAVSLIANGQKVVKDAMVFVRVAKMFKSIDWVFGMLPIVLLGLTLVLFIKAILPTLMTIVKLPAQAASGQLGAGQHVVREAGRRVGGEMVATLCTLGVLLVLTLLSATIIGRVVTPALQSLLSYFSLAVSYLQFVDGASPGLVFAMLFSVIIFLVLNLAVFILSMAFFLGKSQKIFQARWNEGVPLGRHRRFWTWGPVAVLLLQLLPLIYVFIARAGLNAINASITSGVTDAEKMGWGKLMLAGPLFLVVGFAVVFWAARGLKAIKFLAGYKVKPDPQPVIPR